MNPARRYRVAVVAACPFPSLRGSQVLVRQTAEALGRAGHSVHVVTYPDAQHRVPVERITIHRAAKLPGLATLRPLGWQKLVVDLFLLWRLLRVIRAHDIEIVHAHNLEAPVLALVTRWLTGVPFIYHAHNALADELPCYVRRRGTRRLTRLLGLQLDRLLAESADAVIALSDRLAAYLAVRGAAGRITTIPPAAPRLRGIATRPPARGAGSRWVMYAGNLDPYQDLGCLLEAFRRVRRVAPRVNLLLLTHRASHPQTARRARQLAWHAGVCVEQAPSFAAAARRLARADVVVCPRASWSGFPIKTLNYMALGRPIVHARASAHSIADQETGLLFDDGQPAALAEAILRLLREPALAAELGHRASVVARSRYDGALHVNHLLQVYESALQRQGRRARSHPSGLERRPEIVVRESEIQVDVRHQ